EGSLAEVPVVSGDMHHPFIVAILLEQFVAVSKEGLIRNAVVLEDQRPIDMLKYPPDSRSRAEPHAQIDVRIVLQDFTRPVDAFDDFACGRTLFGLTGPVVPWTVRDDEESARLSASDLVDDSSGDLRSIEDDYGDGGVHNLETLARLFSVCDDVES